MSREEKEDNKEEELDGQIIIEQKYLVPSLQHHNNGNLSSNESSLDELARSQTPLPYNEIHEEQSPAQGVGG